MRFSLLVASLGLLLACSGPRPTAPEETTRAAGKEEMQMTNTVDHGEVVSNLQIDRTIMPSGPDHHLNTTFTVRNDSSEPVAMTFNSSQQYDFFITDSGGRQYWKWSHDRFFAQMIVEKELGQEPWVYQERIPTVDQNGNPLPAGEYTLRAKLMADRKVENGIGFRIE